MNNGIRSTVPALFAALAALVVVLGADGFRAAPLAAQQVDAPVVSGPTTWLGIGYDPEDQEDVVVRDVAPGSPAFRAGMSAGDVIVRIEDRPATVSGLVEAVAELAPGDTIRLDVRSEDGDERTVEVVAERRPSVIVRSAPGRGVTVFRLDTMRTTLRALLDSARFTVDRMRPRQITIERTDSTITYHFDGEPIVLRTDSLRRRAELLRVHGDSLRRALRERQALRVDSLNMLMRVRTDSLRRRNADARVVLERMLEASRDDRVRSPAILRYAYGLGDRAVAGAEFAELNPDLGRYFRTEEGLLVLRVLAGTPAARSGLEAGDVVVEAGGHEVRSVADLRLAITAAAGEEPVPLEVVRDGSRMTLRLEREE